MTKIDIRWLWDARYVRIWAHAVGVTRSKIISVALMIVAATRRRVIPFAHEI